MSCLTKMGLKHVDRSDNLKLIYLRLKMTSENVFTSLLLKSTLTLTKLYFLLQIHILSSDFRLKIFDLNNCFGRVALTSTRCKVLLPSSNTSNYLGDRIHF